MSSQMQTTWKRNCCPDSATFDFRPNENLKITEGGFKNYFTFKKKIRKY